MEFLRLLTLAFFFLCSIGVNGISQCPVSCFSFYSFCSEISRIDQGGMDIFLILDKSGSVGNFMPDYLFASQLTTQFDSARTRFAFVVFDSVSQVVLPLTGDRALIAAGLERLKNIQAGGGTLFQTSFQVWVFRWSGLVSRDMCLVVRFRHAHRIQRNLGCVLRHRRNLKQSRHGRCASFEFGQ